MSNATQNPTMQQAVRAAIDLIYSDTAIHSVNLEWETNGRLYRGVYVARRQPTGEMIEHTLEQIELVG